MPHDVREPAAGRYAPSPSADLHLGNLRTAVLADLFARTSGRRLLLRIDDLDAQRSRPEFVHGQQRDLAALGLIFDPPLLRQSGRSAAYADALSALTAAGRTFECFCTRREIAEATSAPHAPRAGDHPGHYPGTCRRLTAAERAERRAVRPPAIRLWADGARQTVQDVLAGQLSGDVDDLVLRRNDGAFGYHLATVVDDRDSGVDQVVRGDDLLDAAFGQAHLARLLGARPPTYAHVPLAVGPDGRRLAKRDQWSGAASPPAITLTDLGAGGVGTDQVLGRIAVSLNLAAPGERVDLPLLRERFDPGRLPRHPWVIERVVEP